MPDQVSRPHSWRQRQAKPIQINSLIFKDIAAQAIMIHIEAALDCIIEIDAAITEAAHDNLTPPTKDTATDLAMTSSHWSYHRSSQHRSSSGYQSQHHSRSHSQPSYRSSRHESHHSSSQSSRTRQKPHLKNNMRVKIEDPHMDYYSSRWSLQWLRRGIQSFKLTEPSPSSDFHKHRRTTFQTNWLQ